MSHGTRVSDMFPLTQKLQGEVSLKNVNGFLRNGMNVRRIMRFDTSYMPKSLEVKTIKKT